MKNYSILAVLLIAIFSSCENFNQRKSKVESFRTPFELEDGQVALDLYIDVRYDTEKEQFVDFDVSPDVLKLTETSKEAFKKQVNSELAKIYDLDTGSSPSAKEGKLRKCLDGCNETFTDSDGNKIKGRGPCRAKCWGEALVRVAVTIIDKFTG